MFKFLKYKSVRAKISLMIPVITCILSVGLSFLLTFIGMQVYLTIFIIFLIISAAVAANYNFIPLNDYLVKKDMRKYYFSRSFYTIIMYALMTAACSLGVNLISDAVIGTIFVRIDPVAGEYINETFLFLFTLFILSRYVMYNGYSDTTHKRYNPYITLNSVIFAFSLIFPVIFTDYLVYAVVGDQIFSSGVVLSRSQFITAYLSAKTNLGYAGLIAGFIIQTAAGTVAMLYYYSEGRRNFYVKHPHDLEYDKDQTDSLTAKS